MHLLAGELEKPEKAPAPPPTMQNFYFEESVEVQFLRFDLDSFWGASGGLNFFHAITVSGYSIAVWHNVNFPTQSCVKLRNMTSARPSTVRTLPQK